MLETMGVALATMFATIGPLNAATVFAGLTAGTPDSRRLLTEAVGGSVQLVGVAVPGGMA